MNRHDGSAFLLCPVCGCPIQKLADGYSGATKGTLDDALRRHSEIVHPEEMPA